MDEVTVPRWALEFVLENAPMQDAGPPGEGWRSDEMEKAIRALESAIISSLVDV